MILSALRVILSTVVAFVFNRVAGVTATARCLRRVARRNHRSRVRVIDAENQGLRAESFQLSVDKSFRRRI